MSDVILARYRNSDYVVRCEIDGNTKRYEWKGSKGNKATRKKVPQAVVDWINLNSECFNKGALVIEGNDETAKELKEEIADKESYENNTHSYDEIVKILKGNTNTMKKKLEAITQDDEKRYVVDIAKEMKDDLTGGKQKFLAEWYGRDVDVLFG